MSRHNYYDLLSQSLYITPTTQGYIAAFPLNSEALNDRQNLGFCCPPEMYSLKFNNFYARNFPLSIPDSPVLSV
jgi:hypothetical protein